MWQCVYSIANQGSSPESLHPGVLLVVAHIGMNEAPLWLSLATQSPAPPEINLIPHDKIPHCKNIEKL